MNKLQNARKVFFKRIYHSPKKGSVVGIPAQFCKSLDLDNESWVEMRYFDELNQIVFKKVEETIGKEIEA